MITDYYKTLGVNKSADAATLKKAFRKQAMKHHPDRNPDDTKAENKFKEVNEAYDVLSDAQKRAAYDRVGHNAFKDGAARGNPGGGGGGAQYGGSQGFGGMEDIFEDLFNGFGGGQGARQRTRGADLQYNLTISLKDAYEGSKSKLSLTVPSTCESCHGSGAAPGARPQVCGTCGGAGAVRVSQGFFNMTQTCPNCHGAGEIVKDKCKDCYGQGRTRKHKNLSIDIPAGVDTGTRIRLSGKGEAGLNGAPAGDLFVLINIKPHPFFEREGANLHLKMPINMVDATLGNSITVPTPDGGKAKLKIPAGTQPSQTFRLKGKGMPHLHRKYMGDLLVTALVEIPTKLDASQRKIVEELGASLKIVNAPQEKNFFKKLKEFWG